MNKDLRKALMGEFMFELDTRPTNVTQQFFYNKREGEHIMISVGKPYRERLKVKGKRVFTKGR